MLTDQDLALAEGQHEALVERIAERTGESRIAIEEVLNQGLPGASERG